MNADIVKELRWLSENDEWVFAAETMAKAADLIESLQAEVLAAKDAARAAQDANSEAGNTITQLQAEKWDVMAQLAEAKRRAERAVADIYHMGGCPNCIYNKGRHPDTGLPMCAILKEFPDGQCFKWRGDAEEGAER